MSPRSKKLIRIHLAALGAAAFVLLAREALATPRSSDNVAALVVLGWVLGFAFLDRRHPQPPAAQRSRVLPPAQGSCVLPPARRSFRRGAFLLARAFLVGAGLVLYAAATSLWPGPGADFPYPVQAVPAALAAVRGTGRGSTLVTTPADPIVLARVVGVREDLALIVDDGLGDATPGSGARGEGEIVWLDGLTPGQPGVFYQPGVSSRPGVSGGENAALRRWLKAHAVGEIVSVCVVGEGRWGGEWGVTAVVSRVDGLGPSAGLTLNEEVTRLAQDLARASEKEEASPGTRPSEALP